VETRVCLVAQGKSARQRPGEIQKFDDEAREGKIAVCIAEPIGHFHEAGESVFLGKVVIAVVRISA
jgi:hypothetical protein